MSKEEVKQIKFLAKSKISNDRLARISKAYEVFKELEKDGKFPISYITKLLKAVKRDDLVVKLKAVPLTEEEDGQGKFQFNGMYPKIVIRHILTLFFCTLIIMLPFHVTFLDNTQSVLLDLLVKGSVSVW